ncbi:sialidase family protein [Bryocella elongata]|nr:sialidase family protein [Bryocella elongata]
MARTLIPESTMYPRLLRLSHGSPDTNGHLMANTNREIFRSKDDGNSWEKMSEVTAIPGSRERCCAAIWELPQDVGRLKAGTLLFSGTFVEGTSAAIQIYTSTDEGATWKYHSTPVKRGGTPHHGLWEPEFLLAKDGSLVIFWSDETDDCCSQKLTQMRSTDGVTWKDEVDTIKSNQKADRPGMIVASKLPDGKYFMSYEVCGPTYHCAVYSRTSKDGWHWGERGDMGTKVITTTGQYLAHAPNNHYMPDGHILLIGQMLLEADGKVSKDNGKVAFVSDARNPLKPWTTTPAPVPIPAAFDNPCPNYSSAMLPTADGKSFIEIASDFDDAHKCSVFEGILPLPPK